MVIYPQRTLLHEVIRRDAKIEIAQYLIEKGIDKYAKDGVDNTALDYFKQKFEGWSEELLENLPNYQDWKQLLSSKEP